MARYYDLDKLSKLIEARADTMLEGKCAMLYVAKWLNLLPTSDVVEVVRCKNCKYGRKTNRIMSPEKFFKEDCVVCECEDVVGDEPMIYVPTHFCSYGTPKEREKE